MRTFRILMLVCVIGLLSSIKAHGQNSLLPNGSFEVGQDAPSQWKLSGGEGKWENRASKGSRSISVTGTGKNSNYWSCNDVQFDREQTYRITFYAKSIGQTSGGCVVSGPSFANRDYAPSRDWAKRSFVFIPTNDPKGEYVRLGQWRIKGTVAFDDVTLTPVTPVHSAAEGIQLGQGERISGKQYSFQADLGYEGGNYSRCLFEHTAGFNSNRWVFGEGSYVIYRHQAGELTQKSGRVEMAMPYYVSGECVIDVSSDGRRWTEVGRVGKERNGTFDIPSSLYPAKAMFIRLRSHGGAGSRGDSQPGSFQISSYNYTAELVETAPQLSGSTRFIDIERESDELEVAMQSLGDLKPGGTNTATLALKNKTGATMSLQAAMTVTSRATKEEESFRDRVELPAGAEKMGNIAYEARGAGDFDVRLSILKVDSEIYAATTNFTVPSLYAADFGHLCGSNETCEWWWCESAYKISKERPAPEKATAIAAAEMKAARGEYEAVQLVLRPKEELKGLTWRVAPEEKALAMNAKLYEVTYHYVKRPTDYSGCVGWWPDALPVLSGPMDLKAGENRPVWLMVKVPENANAGDYDLKVVVKGADASTLCAFPIRLRVYDFALSKERHLAAAFGLSLGNIARYHNLETTEEKKKVWDLYMQNFREHRMAPYDFAPFDPIKVELTGFTWVGGDMVKEEPASGEWRLKLVDETDKATVTCTTDYRIPIDPKKRYRLSWKARTAAPRQKYLVTFNTYDSSGQWISGHNLDMPFEGDVNWKKETKTVVIGERSSNARSVTLSLRPTLWTEAGEFKGTAWFDDVSLKAEGSDEQLIKNGGFEAPAEGHAKVDFTAWDKQAEKYLDDYGFSAFRLGLRGMGGGTFHSRHYGRIGPFKQGSPEYRRIFKEYLMQLQNHLEEKSWLEKAYIYWFDEPAPKDYDFVREGMEEIKLAGPKLRRMLTEEPVEPLFGAVDIWCPVLPNHHPDACHARQKEGETIWWYVCTGPKAPYPGLFIDHSAIDLRMWLWMTWKWNVQAILVWTTNWWTSSCAFPDPKNLQNPWEDPMGYVAGYGLPSGHVGYWGNGDGRFFYPPNRDVNNDKTKYVEGPITSIRWEMLREGIEDYEYFWRLREEIAKAKKIGKSAELIQSAESLLRIPESIIKDKTHFTRDPRPLYEHRNKVALMIERLRK